VALREIVVSTEGKKPEELPDLKKKAETALKRVQDGEDFGEIAKRLSDGSTKSRAAFSVFTNEVSFPRNWKTKSSR